MGKTKNFFLMLKQGIKGVFKFKAQFIIIIILAFIATFILSVSLSTQLRMNDSYNRIVKPVQRFSYSGNIQINSTANSNSDPFILADELDNSGSTDLKVFEKDGDKETLLREVPSFNFVLYNKDNIYKDKDGTPIDTFLTKGTQAYIDANKDKTDAFYNSDNGPKALYRQWMISLFEELKQISDGKENKVEQTKYSPIGLYTRENNNWFSSFVAFDNNGKFDASKNGNGWVNGFNFSDNDAPHKDVFNNVAVAVSELAGWVNQVAGNYNSAESTLSIKDAISFFFGFGDNDKWKLDQSTAYSINSKIYTNDLEGQVFAQFSDDAKSSKSEYAIYNSGLRGITNPLIDFNTAPKSSKNAFVQATDISSDLVTNWDYFSPITISPDDAGNGKIYDIYNNMDIDSDFYSTAFDEGATDSIINNSNNHSLPFEVLFRSHNVISAAATGFDYKLRRETTYFDANNQLKFRAIALNQNENYNFTILKGRYPSQGEVAVSEQFAKKNHLTVGSMIVIGDAHLMISGLATDAFSYMPAQDLSDPIPNPKVSSFIYATPATIDEINGGTKTSDSSDDALTENLSYFLFDTHKFNASVEGRENAFEALFSNDKDNLINNYTVAKQFYETRDVANKIGSSHLSLDSFDKSGFRYSWTLQPLVFKMYDAITYTVAGVVALIAMIALIVCVKKTIDLNSKQIGILKALGEKPTSISVNYLSYSMIIMVIVVPIAWLVGIVLQIPFGNMFQNYFSVQPDAMLFDWISFVIAFGVLGVLSAAVSYLSAWMLTNKPVLKVLTSSVKWGRLRLLDWMKNHTFKRAPFSTRFSLTLTSSGSKQIVLMTVVMFVASFLMSAVLAIPAIVVKVNSSYYKSVAYANKYDEIPMTGNMPLSKNSISYWNGQDYLDQNSVGGDKALQLDNSGARYGYYDDPEAYVATVSNSNTMSQYLYDTNNTQNPNNHIADGSLYILQHQQDLMNVVGTMFGSNFFTHLGVSFSIGEIDKLYGVLLHSLDPVFGSENGDNTKYTDDVKLAQARNLSGWLTTAVPKIIGTIVDTNAGSSSNSDAQSDSNTSDTTWKQKVMNVIFKVVPSYVKAYIKQSDSRLDQYAIAYQNEIYIPGQETLTTNVDDSDPIINGKNQTMTLTGLDKYQNSIKLGEKDIDKVYLPESIKKKLYDIINAPVNDTSLINKDVTYNGEKLYDGSTHTLTLPVLPNQQAASAYSMSDGNSMSWNNNVQLIQMKTLGGSYFDLPSTAWVYNDSDWGQYLDKSADDNEITKYYKGHDSSKPTKMNIYDPAHPNDNWIYDNVNGNYYLNANTIDNNKLTYTNEFNNGLAVNSDGHQVITGNDGKISLRDRAQLFKNFMYDKDGNPIGSYVRPYYQYKNMQLMVPEAWINPEKLRSPSGKGTDTKQWWNEINYSDVPKSVSDGYEKLSMNKTDNSLDWDAAKSGKWLVINPYDINFTQNDLQQTQKQPLSNLIDGPAYWYRYALEGDSQLRMVTDQPVTSAWANRGAASGDNGIKIRLKSVGTIDSYNDKLVVIDSDFANMLAEYPINRHYEYNYQTFDRSSEVKPGATPKNDANQNFTSQFSRYKWYINPKDDVSVNFINNVWGDNSEAKTRDLWQLSYSQYISALNGNPISYYAPHAFYNGKLSNIDEPLNYTSQISFTKKIRWGQAAINLGDNTGGGTPSIIQSSTLLSTTKELIKQVAVLAIAIGAMLMVAIIITAALVTMLTGDIYIAQYQRFMVLLRALGYSKSQVFTYTFGTVTILSLIAWICGTILAWGIIFIAVGIMWNAGFAIPVGITWWPILISLVIMFASYFGSLYVSSGRARKSNPSTILTATAE